MGARFAGMYSEQSSRDVNPRPRLYSHNGFLHVLQSISIANPVVMSYLSVFHVLMSKAFWILAFKQLVIVVPYCRDHFSHRFPFVEAKFAKDISETHFNVSIVIIYHGFSERIS